MAHAPPAPPFATADHDRARRLAARLLQRERRGHTLQPTALLHEAWLRLWQLPRAGLCAGALQALLARAMRRVLVDHARRRSVRLAAAENAACRLDAAIPAVPATRVRELERCLATLAATAPRLAKVVELRFLAGMSVPAVAAWLGVTERTVVRDWADARARLRRWLGDAGD